MDRPVAVDRLTRAAMFARMERLFPSGTCLPLAAAALLGGLASTAHAATIVVNSTADPGDAGTCTLRQAILSMDTGSVTANWRYSGTVPGNCVNTGGAFGSSDTINFAGGLFAANTATITLADSYRNGLYIRGVPSFGVMDLDIDAGNGRNVTIQRPQNAQQPFSIIRALMGFVSSPGNLHLTGLTLQNGNADSGKKYSSASYPGAAGGGILATHANVTLDRCEISDSVAVWGGGIAVEDGALTLNSSVITGNTSRPGPHSPYQSLYMGGGGGIYASAHDVTINNSTISGNVSQGASGAAAMIASNSSIHIANSTVSENVFEPPPGGGLQGAPAAIWGLTDVFSLLNSTIACNDGGTTAITTEISVDAISTIFADTANALCPGASISTEVHATAAISGDHNLLVTSSAIDAGAAFPADTIFGDPLLGPLQNNGGATSTHALGALSPALDAGSNPSGQAYDQRGADMARWVGSAPDIGAYEDQTSHLCGTAWGQSFTSMSPSTPNLCSSGAYLYGGVVAGSGPWAWVCAANADSSHTEFCGARVQASVELLIENASGGIISSAVFGQPLHLKAVASGGSSTPTGTMTFADVTGGGFVPLCVNLTLSGGETLCDTTNNPIDAGARQLKAVYNGDGTFGTASSSPGGIQINLAATTTSISSQTPNPVTVGVPFTVVAQVAAKSPSVVAPNGTAEIDDQTDGLSCTYDLSAATPGCALTPVSVGTHNLLISYLGNSNMSGSSIAGQETVSAVVTSTALSATPGAITFGQGVNLQATLSFAGSLVPGGTVAFCDGGSVGDATFCASGTLLCGAAAVTATSPYTAACAPTLSAGSHAITARYLGDAKFAASTSTAHGVDVAPAATSVQVSLPVGAITLGDSVLVTATVASGVSPAAGVPGGAIAVSDGGAGGGDTCTITLPATSCTLTPTSTGAKTIMASYAGDGDFAASSASNGLTVDALPQLSLTITDDHFGYARYGDSIQYTIMLDNTGGPAGNVAVSAAPSANLNGAIMQWQCAPGNGATCTASGSGTALTDNVNLPANSSLTWTVNVTVPAAASGAAVQLDANADAATASDRDTLVVFRNGFD